MPAPSPDPRLRRNPALLCAFRALQMSLFPMAIVTLFFRHEMGLSMTEIMALQALFGFTTAVFEFPSGFVADRVGYRRTLMAASIVATLGWSVFVFAPSFWLLAAGEVLLGIALSLTSGTDAALLYESLLETDREADYARWYGRFQFFGQSAEGSAALLAGLLFATWVRLPFLLQIGVWIVAAGVAYALVEPARHRPVVRDPVRRAGRILRYAALEAPRLRALIVATVTLGTATFIPVWIVSLYAEAAGVPVAWIGPIWAVANYTVALGALASTRIGLALGFAPTLGLSIALIVLGYVGMGLTSAWFGFAFYYAFTLVRGVSAPLLGHEEQRVIPSSDRAALLSVKTFAFRGAFVAIGPAIGAAIDREGEHAVLLGTGLAAFILCSAAVAWLARSTASARPPAGSAP